MPRTDLPPFASRKSRQSGMILAGLRPTSSIGRDRIRSASSPCSPSGSSLFSPPPTVQLRLLAPDHHQLRFPRLQSPPQEGNNPRQVLVGALVDQGLMLKTA